MTDHDHDRFDQRLTAALRAYAAEAATDVEAVGLARSIVTEHPRRTGWARLAGSRSTVARLGWLVALGLTILALAVGAVMVGSSRENDLSIGPEGDLPLALRGNFRTQLAGPGPGVDFDFYLLDLTSTALVFGPSKAEDPAVLRTMPSAIPWAPRGTTFAGAGEGRGTLTINAGGVCGAARYTADYDTSGIDLTVVSDPCPQREAVLTARRWQHASDRLTATQLYDSWYFTEPFEFVLPEMDSSTPDAVVNYWFGPGQLRIANGYSWTTWFLDDEPLPAELCQPDNGSLADIPNTRAEFETWIRANSAGEVRGPVEIEVDGRVALRFDTNGSGCPGADGELLLNALVGAFRFYVIPTGDDTILYVVWSDEGSHDPVALGADELVRSMIFEPPRP